MKHILITAGVVYGPLDANKLVGNRVRGLWAEQFAHYLCERGYAVTLLVADIFQLKSETLPQFCNVVRHKGFHDYHQKCLDLAPRVNAAVMAAAVVNWIPAEPFPGKMPTKGYKAGDVIQVPFVLAPHVIDEMKVANPNLTLIGCKMLVNAEKEDLIEAAYGVVLKARCNAVVANDMGKGLRTKYVVNQDRTVQEYKDDFQGLYANLLAHIEDIHYPTFPGGGVAGASASERTLFDRVVEKYRDRFIHRAAGSDYVFGSVLVPTMAGALVSPREKGSMFSSQDAVDFCGVDDYLRRVYTMHGEKVTLNALLLYAVARKYTPRAVLHLHEQLKGFPTVEYAPPGTVRDNYRKIPGPVFNIKGHGFIACLDYNLDIYTH